MWYTLSREWLKSLEKMMVEYRKYEQMCRDYIEGRVSLSNLTEFHDALVAMGASPSKLGDIYLRVSKETMDRFDVV
jgi:hypothetical protein